MRNQEGRNSRDELIVGGLVLLRPGLNTDLPPGIEALIADLTPMQSAEKGTTAHTKQMALSEQMLTVVLS